MMRIRGKRRVCDGIGLLVSQDPEAFVQQVLDDTTLQDFLERQGLSWAQVEAVARPIATEGLPEDCRNMLVAMAPYALGDCVEQRDRHQEAVVGMLDEIYGQHLRRVQAVVDEARLKGAGVGEKVQRFTACLRESEAKHIAAVAETHRRQAVLSKASDALAAVREYFTTTEATQQVAAAALARRNAELGECEVVLNVSFVKLRKGASQSQLRIAEICCIIREVHKFVKKLYVDETMLASLPGALIKEPHERTTTDEAVFSDLEKRLRCHHESCAAAVRVESERVCTHAIAMVKASEDIEAATKTQEQAEDRVRAAIAEEAKAESAVRNARDVLLEQALRTSSISAPLRAAEEELEKFHANHYDVFIKLRDRVGGCLPLADGNNKRAVSEDATGQCASDVKLDGKFTRDVSGKATSSYAAHVKPELPDPQDVETRRSAPMRIKGKCSYRLRVAKAAKRATQRVFRVGPSADDASLRRPLGKPRKVINGSSVLGSTGSRVVPAVTAAVAPITASSATAASANAAFAAVPAAMAKAPLRIHGAYLDATPAGPPPGGDAESPLHHIVFVPEGVRLRDAVRCECKNCGKRWRAQDHLRYSKQVCPVSRTRKLKREH